MDAPNMPLSFELKQQLLFMGLLFPHGPSNSHGIAGGSQAGLQDSQGFMSLAARLSYGTLLGSSVGELSPGREGLEKTNNQPLLLLEY
jgi:hypothetical protein